MKSLRGALIGAVGVVLGLQALRTFLTGLVWMIGEQLHPNAMGIFALGLGALGLLARAVRTGLGQVRAERYTAVALTLLYVLSIHVSDTSLRVGLAAAATMVWIWWFATFVCGRQTLAAALVIGLGIDVAVHAVLSGLDLPFAGSVLGAALLGTLFLRNREAPAPEEDCPGWGILGLAPWLFIQMEVLTSLARIRIATGLGLTGATIVAELGLAVGLMLMTLPLPGLLRAGLGVLAALSLVAPSGLLWLFVAQAGLGAALAASLRPGRPWHWSPVAVMLLMALFFLFYIRMTWPALPGLCALLLALIGLLVHSDANLPGPQEALAMPLLLAGLAVVGMLARPGPGPVTALPPPPGAIRLMTYNIHQGLDVRSLPSPERIARVIEQESPDIVALQEVNRGWVIAGGSDIVSWIERRLPGYHVVYGPMVGDLWGTVILSRLPVLQSGDHHFQPRVNFTTGYSWVIVDVPGCPTLVTSVHLASGRQLGGERYVQMQQLLGFWNGRPCTIIMGDTNAEPNSPTMSLMSSAGFTDLLGRWSESREATWPADDPLESIDYIATTAEYEGLAARSIKTQASDHRPVVADVRLLRP